jgi:hypothetical protein
LRKRFALRGNSTGRIKDFDLAVARRPALDDPLTAEHIVETLELHGVYGNEIDNAVKDPGQWDWPLFRDERRLYSVTLRPPLVLDCKGARDLVYVRIEPRLRIEEPDE